MKFLDLTGVGTLWSKVKTLVSSQLSGYVQKDGDKVLSDNNFTDALLSKLDGIEANANNFQVTDIPDATTSNKGLVKVGAGLTVTSGTISTVIQTIKLNGSNLTPSGGVIDLGSIATSTALEEIDDKVTTLESTVAGHTTSLSQKVNTSDIVQASGQSTTQIMSQKAVTDFVNEQVQTSSAHYLTKDATGTVFATKAELTGASTFYYGDQEHTPHDHDYVFVQVDESQDNYSTRYVYSGGNWVLQYKVNETALTSAQLNAINSGITADKVSTYDGYETDISNLESNKVDKTQIKTSADNSATNVFSTSYVTSQLNTKADKATNLAGYGITDAYINSRTITLGGNSIEVPEEDTAITSAELEDILV